MEKYRVLDYMQMVMSTLSIHISISKQLLRLILEQQEIRKYLISTAKNGPGELMNSECTPRGGHIIRAKIGFGEPINSVFVSRRPTGELYNLELRDQNPDRDWILTRILWLSGLEPGKNRLGRRDTMRRFVYIHGCPDEDPMGIPSSHGCIKMRNNDVIDLYDQIPIGTHVFIEE